MVHSIHKKIIKCKSQREYGIFSSMMCTSASLIISCAMVIKDFLITEDDVYIQYITDKLMQLASKLHRSTVKDSNEPTSVHHLLSLFPLPNELGFTEYVICPSIKSGTSVLHSPVQLCDLLEQQPDQTKAAIITENNHTKCIFRAVNGSMATYDPWTGEYSLNLNAHDICNYMKTPSMADITLLQKLNL